MEDILSSIRRVIEREDATRIIDDSPASSADDDSDEPLELTQASEFHEPDQRRAPQAETTSQHAADPVEDDATILSSDALAASRQTLASLLHIGSDTPAAPATAPTTIDDLVRESLKPMLKGWLDEHLPGLVERIVTREVERLTKRDD
ncbi:DUF2497 domain-containing protein [Flavisphingopyxis soli]|nr:DUF2497 domain-containing protein [Sphingorhabdus soli]